MTFLLVAFAWIFFRANNLDDAIYVIKNMFANLNEFNNIGAQFRGLGIYTNDIIKYFFLILFLIGYSTYERTDDVWRKLQLKPSWIRWSIYYIMMYGILFLAPHSTINNFIYFQF